MLMSELEIMSAYELARLIGRLIGIETSVKRCDSNSDSFFEFESDDMSVYCADVPVREIAKAEKNRGKTQASYYEILNMANNSLGDNNVPESVRYSVFAILHEFGHFVFFQSVESKECKEKIAERRRLLGIAQERLRRDAENGLSELESRSRYERSYRVIPFEQVADEFAQDNMAFVIGSLTHAAED